MNESEVVILYCKQEHGTLLIILEFFFFNEFLNFPKLCENDMAVNSNNSILASHPTATIFFKIIINKITQLRMVDFSRS